MYKKGLFKESFIKKETIIILILLFGISILMVKYINNIFNCPKPVNNVPAREKTVLNKEINSQSDKFTLNQAIADKNITVILDAGHGGGDSGTDVDGVLEKDINLDITLKLGKLLQNTGVKCIYTRDDDEFVSINERVKFVNNLKADFLISIHNNSFEDDTLVNGTSTLYYMKDKTENNDFNSKDLAEIVQTELIKKLNTKDIGTVERKNLGMLKLVKIPSVIAEIAFLTNPTDRENLMKEEFRQNTAEAVATAVIKVIQEKF